MTKSISRILSLAIIAGFTFFAVASSQDKAPENTEANESSKQEGDTKSVVKIGEVLHTQYFDVTANSVSIQKSVKTGDEYSQELKAETGNKFLIFNVTFKNIDQESRMIEEGSLWINYNGKDYQFDHSETMMEEGWGILLDQINPLTSKTTNLVYKIPEEIKGTVLWNPGRSDKDEVINLGDI